MIGDAWMQELHRYLTGTISGLGAKAHAVSGVADHVHILLGYKSSQPLADLVREIKKSSSSWASERYHAFAWQAGYAGLSVGYRELPAVTAYIQNQEEHHRTMSSADELRALLEEFGIEWDARYFE
jgi:REP element-mobilizing transposase RayT